MTIKSTDVLNLPSKNPAQSGDQVTVVRGSVACRVSAVSLALLASANLIAQTGPPGPAGPVGPPGVAGTSGGADLVQSIDASSSISFGESVRTLIKATAGAGGINLTLPTSVGISGQIVKVVMVDTGAGGVTLHTSAAQTINGAASYQLVNQWQYVEVTSDDENWIITAAN